MKRNFTLLVTVSVVLSFLSACAQPAPTAVPTKPVVITAATTAPAPPAAATSAPAAATKPAATPTAVSPAINRGGTLRAAFVNHPTTLDFAISNARAMDKAYTLQLYDSLIYMTDKFDLKPGLAESWQVVDEKTIMLKLRKGLKFHDGNPLLAKDVKYNLDRILDRNTKATIRGDLDPVTEVETPDDATVRIKLKEPYAPILYLLGDTPGMVASPAAIQKWGDQYGRHPVGAGPFQFVEWLDGDRVTTKKFADYWRMGEDGKPLPYVEQVVTRIIVDDSVRLLELKSGSLDIVDKIPPKDVAATKTNPDLVYAEVPAATIQYMISFNMSAPLFRDNKPLREAFRYALDGEVMLKTIVHGVGYYNCLPVSKGQWTVNEAIQCPKVPDLDKGKAKMKEAGYPDGLKVTASVINRALDQQLIQMVKQQLSPIGVDVTIDLMERIAWVAKAQAGNFEFVTNINNHPRADSGASFALIFMKGANANWALYDNPEIQELIRKGNQVYDVKERKKYFDKVQEIAFNEVPQVYFFHNNWSNTYNKKVRGLEVNHEGIWRLETAWVQK
jgi:peptide/nickel transport system substrate-binding protein